METEDALSITKNPINGSYEDLTPEEAQQEALRLMTAAGVTAKVSAALGAVDETGDHAKRPWPHTAYVVTYKSGELVTVELPYKMGIGCVLHSFLRPIEALNHWPVGCKYTESDSYTARNMLNGKQRHLHNQAELAAKIVNIFNASQSVKQGYKKPLGAQPAEVLATVCGDALEAIESTFEDWAGNFGYDSDSRKAEAIYNTCRNYLPDMLRLVGREGVEHMAEIARMF